MNAPASFPRAVRVLHSLDFTRLRNEGRRIGGRHFSVQMVANEIGEARLGLAVSRRVSRRAVRRNRIKRMARESFRCTRRQLPAIDILLIARSSANLEDNASLRTELAGLWRLITALNTAEGAGTIPD